MTRKFFSCFLVLVLAFLSAQNGFATDSSDSEKSNKYITSLFNSWKINASDSHSNGNINLRIHSSIDIPKASVEEFANGATWTLNKYSGFFSGANQFHFIMSSSYEDFYKFSNEVNAVLPGYSAYNPRHMSIAENFFQKPTDEIPAGGTSSRGCIIGNSAYGFVNNVIQPCPALNGGVMYMVGTLGGFKKYSSNLFSIGAHEATHLVLTSLNSKNHIQVPEWLIEGFCVYVSSVATTSVSNLNRTNTVLIPTPTLDPSTQKIPYDLANLESNNGGGVERFTLGSLAVALLVDEFGIEKVLSFYKNVNAPDNWQTTFQNSFGISKETFYAQFSDFHAWYYSTGLQKIKSFDFSKLVLLANPQPATKPNSTPDAGEKAKADSKKIAIQCAKGKIIKKLTGINPKCPKGYKLKA